MKGFCPESCCLRPLSKLFMNVMQEPAPYLPHGTMPGPRAQIVGLFLVFVAKIPYVPEAPRNINPARE